MTTVTIIGSALTGNKGAAAMLESAVAELTARHAHVEIVLLSMYPRSDAALNPYPNLRILDASPVRLGVLINSAALAWRIAPWARRRLERAVPEVGALSRSAVLLDQGGITFVDGREKFLLYNVASILPGLNTRTPVVKCAQALGPFASRLNRWAAKTYLPRMAAIISRGAVTHEHLTGLGLTNITSGADLAFTLEVSAEEQERADAFAGDFFDAGDVVGVSPSQVLRAAADSQGEDYVATVADQIDHLTGTMGRRVLLVAHSARSGTDKLHNNDLPVCRAIHAAVAHPDKVLFIDEEISSQVLRALIGRCDIMVASRFHAMVSALAMGVPTLVLGWSHKYQEVLDMFGLAEWAMPADAVTPGAFRTRVAELAEASADVRATIARHLPEVRATARSQMDVVDRIVAERPAP